MKKPVFGIAIFALILSFFVSIPAFSQKVEQADVYYVNVQILKIFAHQKGFYVIYKTSDSKHIETFIPKAWLEPTDGRANMELVNTRVHPYLSFFIKDGKFDHVKIAAPRDIRHNIWGTLAAPNEYDSKFDGVEALELKF